MTQVVNTCPTAPPHTLRHRSLRQITYSARLAAPASSRFLNLCASLRILVGRCGALKLTLTCGVDAMGRCAAFFPPAASALSTQHSGDAYLVTARSLRSISHTTNALSASMSADLTHKACLPILLESSNERRRRRRASAHALLHAPIPKILPPLSSFGPRLAVLCASSPTTTPRSRGRLTPLALRACRRVSASSSYFAVSIPCRFA